MVMTRRKFGAVKSSQNTENQNRNHLQQQQRQDQQSILKRPLAESVSNAHNVPAKRKNIQNVEKENHTIKIESIERKIVQIKISEDSSRSTVRAVKSRPSTSENISSNNKQTDQTSNKKIFRPENYYRPADLPDDITDYDRSQLFVGDAEPVYAYDIFKYLKNKEKEMVATKYMDKHAKITEKMRAILVDWLVEVQQSFELFHETLYLSVKYVDHYLMKKTIPTSRLQLLGLTAVFIAAKFEERTYPCIEDLIYMCDDAYTKDEFIQMEMDILATLNFDINFPLSYSFLRRYSRCAATNIETLTLARYILESSLLGYCFIDQHDSKVSAAALLLANRMQNMQEPWTRTLTFYSGYNENDLNGLASELNKFITKVASVNNDKRKRQDESMENQANVLGENIFSKYSDCVFHRVSRISPLPM